MELNTSMFRSNILEEIGAVQINTSMVNLVLLVRDEIGRVRVSIQTWSKDSTGKYSPIRGGYSLNGRKAVNLSERITDSLNKGETSELEISNTQKIECSISEELLVISKWWRKDVDSEWTFSKSMSIPKQYGYQLSNYIKEAGRKIIYVK